jgi:general stress protein YciG
MDDRNASQREEKGMPNKPGNDDQDTGLSDRERQREISNEGARTAPSASGTSPRRSNRGFASMDPSKQKEIASKGGRAAHAKGTAHEFDSGEAREAGRKGGQAVSRNRDHMAAIGRRGGEARGHARSRGTSGAASNSGATTGSEGSFQNSRSGLDREVSLSNQSEGVNANPQGNRGGTGSIGGERRPTSNDNSSRESSGNH